jgi:hypothetical protein
MTISAIMFITAGLLLLIVLSINQTKKHQVEANKIMTSLSTSTKQDDATIVDEKLSLEEYREKVRDMVNEYEENMNLKMCDCIKESTVDLSDDEARSDFAKELAFRYAKSLRTAQRAIQKHIENNKNLNNN